MDSTANPKCEISSKRRAFIALQDSVDLPLASAEHGLASPQGPVDG